MNASHPNLAAGNGHPPHTYFILRAGEILGPFDIPRINELIDSGELNECDFAQESGKIDWQPLYSVIQELGGAEKPQPVAPSLITLAKWAWLRIKHDIDGGSLAVSWFFIFLASLGVLISHWRALFYLPFLALTCLCGVLLLKRNRKRTGGLLIALAGLFIFVAEGTGSRIIARFKRETPSPTQISVNDSQPQPARPDPPEIKLPEKTPLASISQNQSLEPLPESKPSDQLAEKTPPPLPIWEFDIKPAENSKDVSATPNPLIASPTVAMQRPTARVEPPVEVPQIPPTGAIVNESATAFVDELVHVVTTDKGTGSAFFVRLNGQVFIVTNYHVIRGASKAKFTSKDFEFELNGNSEIDVADDRDLVRIPASFPRAMQVRNEPTLKEKITVFGNPGGAGVITAEHGILIGIGRSEVEVSAHFIPGNSGGPITDSRGDVIGIATYLVRHPNIVEWGKRGTRFDSARRFGIRLDDSLRWGRNRWEKISEDGKILEAVESFFNDAKRLAFALFSSPYSARFTGKIEDHWSVKRFAFRQSYDGRIAAYNAIVESSAPKDIRSKARGHLVNLGDTLSEASKDLSRIPHQFSTTHTQAAFSKLLDEMREFGTELRKNKFSGASGGIPER